MLQVKAPLANYKGEPFLYPASEGEGPKPVPLGDILIEALHFRERNTPIDGRETVRRAKLAQEIHTSDSLDLTVADRTLLLSLIPPYAALMALPIGVVSEAIRLLDPEQHKRWLEAA